MWGRLTIIPSALLLLLHQAVERGMEEAVGTTVATAGGSCMALEASVEESLVLMEQEVRLACNRPEDFVSLRGLYFRAKSDLTFPPWAQDR